MHTLSETFLSLLNELFVYRVKTTPQIAYIPFKRPKDNFFISVFILSYAISDQTRTPHACMKF